MYLPIFTYIIGSYLLWSPVLEGRKQSAIFFFVWLCFFNVLQRGAKPTAETAVASRNKNPLNFPRYSVFFFPPSMSCLMLSISWSRFRDTVREETVGPYDGASISRYTRHSSDSIHVGSHPATGAHNFVSSQGLEKRDGQWLFWMSTGRKNG